MAGSKRGLAVLLLVLASDARAEEPPPVESSFLQAEGHISFLSDAADRSILGDTVGWAVRGGHRWDQWGLFAQVEQNMWWQREFETELVAGALNVGLGLEYIYFEERARAQIALGPSILLFDTALDEAGEVGIFLDVRPTGLRYRCDEDWVLQFDPLTFTLVAPVLGGIPLTLVEFRTVLTLEYDL